MRPNKKYIKRGILILKFINQYDMCSRLMRCQEMYESPCNKFRDKHDWTHEEYFDWYANDKGRMSYYDDWAGFNFPYHYIDELDKSHDKWKKEIELIEVVRSIPNVKYIIGVMVGKDAALDHELAHALFHINKEYKAKAIALVNELPRKIRTDMEWKLSVMGYSKKTMVDELHAYMIDGFDVYQFNKKELKVIAGIRKSFNKLYSEYI